MELYHYFSIHLHGVHRNLTFLTLEHDMSFLSVLSLAVEGKMQETEVGIQCDRWRETYTSSKLGLQNFVASCTPKNKERFV